MTNLEQPLAALRSLIAQKKKELDELENALAVIEKFVLEPEKIAGNDVSEGDGVIKLDELVLEGGPSGRHSTFTNDVIDVIRRLGDQEFSVAHIDTLMRKMGKISGEKSPRPRISALLGKLEESGMLERTFKGGGNVPHKYRLKVQDETAQNELSEEL
ncbi:hypothetical protein ebA768 [Aromatoleum aromaticum EbN1]|uniref:Uncharacterized protein n=1 Tax=Aromatoleum aromaticum (strain DSM 19018 / LMG 30748 / EbN1) TaxID=76114 RepID=Q5P843_AROAE|nr:hypothetical protein [Aromatoleum aromaticum]CAI06518.1 hypothetical protein ebA768 [Aromatoleum aromaticum EbN1]